MKVCLLGGCGLLSSRAVPQTAVELHSYIRVEDVLRECQSFSSLLSIAFVSVNRYDKTFLVGLLEGKEIPDML